jgi:hypothetical protein
MVGVDYRVVGIERFSAGEFDGSFIAADGGGFEGGDALAVCWALRRSSAFTRRNIDSNWSRSRLVNGGSSGIAFDLSRAILILH